jgi:hypothetical protein
VFIRSGFWQAGTLLTMLYAHIAAAGDPCCTAAWKAGR